MVLPFIAMAVGGAIAAIGAKKQADATNQGIEQAQKVPLVEKSESNLNLPTLVEESRKAGFNPLTVLRAGGVAGYATQTHTTTGHNAHLYAQKQSPAGAFLGGIGNTISNVAGAVLQNSQHMASLASSERIAAYSALPAFGAGGFGQGGGSGPAYGGATSNLQIEGRPISPAPGWSKAADIQDWFGEPAEWLYSVPFMIRTLVHEHDQAQEEVYDIARRNGVTLEQRLTEQQPGATGQTFDPMPGWNWNSLQTGIMQPAQ